jgi:hypothetical protein
MQCTPGQTRLPGSSAAHSGMLAAALPQPCQLALPRTRRRGERVQARAGGNGSNESSTNGLQASSGKRPPPPQQPVQPANGQVQRLRNLMATLGLASGLPTFGQRMTAGKEGQPLAANASATSADQQGGDGWGALSSGWGNGGNGGGSNGSSNSASAPSAGATSTTTRPRTADDINGWGTSWTQDWDPEEDLDEVRGGVSGW